MFRTWGEFEITCDYNLFQKKNLFTLRIEWKNGLSIS